MQLAHRRILAGIVIAGATMIPGAAVANAATTPAQPAAGQIGIHKADSDDSTSKSDSDKDKEKKEALDKIQDVLKDIQDTKKPADLDKNIMKDVVTLETNKKGVPASKKFEFQKFAVELVQAHAKKQLTGSDADKNLKKIQSDAKTLSSDLKSS